MARQEATLQSMLDTEKNIKVLRKQVIDKDRTNALVTMATIKAAMDAMSTLLNATSVAVDFDTLA